MRFGRLVALECVGYKAFACGNKNSSWRCQCDCGKEVTVSRCTIRHFIRNGQRPTEKWGCVPSCGCSYREALPKKRPDYKFKTPRPQGQAGKNLLWKMYTSAARKRGFEWCISRDQFYDITGQPCHYCGVQPFKVKASAGKDRAQDYTYNGIDRKDNSGGYTENNIVPCCSICNWAKHIMSYATFIKWLDRVAKHIINATPS